jgi:ubiquinone/menaquinone biosynthesis C-methylase UbiE
MLRSWLAHLRALLGGGRDLRYWKRRARRLGTHAVLHKGHGAEEDESVTRTQQEFLFPLLRSRLRGDERVILDFGCGPGRFTPALARLVGGSAIGVDPIAELIALAPPAPDVTYHVSHGAQLPLPSRSVDVVWSCLVLSSITHPAALHEAVTEIERVLKPGGLLFLVDNTTAGSPRRHLRFRSISEYAELFPATRLEHLGDYEDLGERISVLVGRIPERPR